MERIDFVSFNCALLIHSDMTKAGAAVYAPLIYGFEDRYFNACVEFLKTGKAEDLVFNKYSTDLLQTTMGASYIQALVILHHIEKAPEQAPIIYNPRSVE